MFEDNVFWRAFTAVSINDIFMDLVLCSTSSIRRFGERRVVLVLHGTKSYLLP
jgi:hypothetical protein